MCPQPASHAPKKPTKESRSFCPEKVHASEPCGQPDPQPHPKEQADCERIPHWSRNLLALRRQLFSSRQRDLRQVSGLVYAVASPMVKLLVFNGRKLCREVAARA
jgi:hypothetical protein